MQTLAAGGTLPIKLVFSMAELYVRRTDKSTTQVTVEAQIGTGSAVGGTTPAQAEEIAVAAAAASVAMAYIPQADYVVDSVNGDDSNDGKADGYGVRPFRTIARLLQETIYDGTRIALASGSVWREQLIVTAPNVVVFGFGFGERPLFDCADIISSSAWSKTSGQTNIYQATLPIDWITEGKTLPNLWAGGVIVQLADSLAHCDATVGTWWRDISGPSFVLYLHAESGANPAVNGVTYEYSARSYGLDTHSSISPIITHIAAKRNAGADGSVRVGVGGVITDCSCSDGGLHNILVRGNTRVRNVVCERSYYKPGGNILFVYHEPNAGHYTVEFTRCVARNTEGDPSVLGFFGHGGEGCSFDVTYSACSTQDCSLGGGPQDGLVAITDCNIDPQIAYGPGCATSVAVLRTRCELITALNDANWSIVDCSILSNKADNTNGLELSLSGKSAVIIGTSISGRRAVFFYDVPQSVTITNCDLSESGWVSYRFANFAAVVLRSDYNLFPNPALGAVADLGSGWMDFAQWVAASSQDANSATKV